ncbi:hypothetical protein BJ508DRAFT_338169 [Ascobolus immersus RN42]|uniref:Uncharacterized protein n=1 Tax=Ascobolus immersus RN42 TaxID=1160509 RepID=A0A3N4IK35_ASCIM|nr:hypothetical protein BJ508DRAFT_338169 [Ascobolus immersus RN42]
MTSLTNDVSTLVTTQVWSFTPRSPRMPSSNRSLPFYTALRLTVKPFRSVKMLLPFPFSLGLILLFHIHAILAVPLSPDASREPDSDGNSSSTKVKEFRPAENLPNAAPKSIEVPFLTARDINWVAIDIPTLQPVVVVHDEVRHLCLQEPSIYCPYREARTGTLSSYTDSRSRDKGINEEDSRPVPSFLEFENRIQQPPLRRRTLGQARLRPGFPKPSFISLDQSAETGKPPNEEPQTVRFDFTKANKHLSRPKARDDYYQASYDNTEDKDDIPERQVHFAEEVREIPPTEYKPRLTVDGRPEKDPHGWWKGMATWSEAEMKNTDPNSGIPRKSAGGPHNEAEYSESEDQVMPGAWPSTQQLDHEEWCEECGYGDGTW